MTKIEVWIELECADPTTKRVAPFATYLYENPPTADQFNKLCTRYDTKHYTVTYSTVHLL